MQISKINSTVRAEVNKSGMAQRAAKTNKTSNSKKVAFTGKKGSSSGKKGSSASRSNRFIALLPVNVLSSMSKQEAKDLIDKAALAY